MIPSLSKSNLKSRSARRPVLGRRFTATLLLLAPCPRHPTECIDRIAQGVPTQYTRLGTTGNIVSRFAFGTMTFGADPRFPAVAKVDLDSAKALTDRAFDAGLIFFTPRTASPEANPKFTFASF